MTAYLPTFMTDLIHNGSSIVNNLSVRIRLKITYVSFADCRLV
jgi:hypothetical protein